MQAGFTADAIRKAKRVGIGLIAVFKEGDKRVRFEVNEEIYLRRVRVESLTISLPSTHLHDTPFYAITYQGIPVGNWVARRARLLIGLNPIGTFPITLVRGCPLSTQSGRSRCRFATE